MLFDLKKISINICINLLAKILFILIGNHLLGDWD